jgi:general stress protein 26
MELGGVTLRGGGTAVVMSYDDDPAKPLSELMKPGSTLMVGTRDASDELDFRPLTVARVSGHRIEILLDTNEPWVAALDQGDRVEVTMSDTKDNTWVALHGTVSISTDSKLIDELWNPFAGAYFDNGRDTPGIAVMQIDAGDGRYWTTASGRIGSLISIVRAKFGDPEESGEHGAIAL